MLSHEEFITQYTKLQYLSFIPEIRLFLREEHLLHPCLQQEFGKDTLYPYWSTVWAGGLALSRHIINNPHLVKDKHVVDFCSGGGIVGIAAAMCGAASVTCVDHDELALSSSILNARANKVSIKVSSKITDGDLILAGDPAIEQPVFDILKSYDEICVGCPIRIKDLVVGLAPIASYNIINKEFPKGTETYIMQKIRKT
jgi:predicted nicotinamide N-methyase